MIGVCVFSAVNRKVGGVFSVFSLRSKTLHPERHDVGHRIRVTDFPIVVSSFPRGLRKVPSLLC